MFHFLVFYIVGLSWGSQDPNTIFSVSNKILKFQLPILSDLQIHMSILNNWGAYIEPSLTLFTLATDR